MALLKTLIVEETGVRVEYWRVTHAQADWGACVLDVQLHGYHSQAAREADKNPLSRLNFRLQLGAFNEVPTRSEIYGAIRAQPGADGEGAGWFSDAEDI